MEKKARPFSVTRVVTKNIVTDSFQGIRNLFGLRLRGYEAMINKANREVLEEISFRFPKAIWWRLSINPMTKGSVMITAYGEHYG